MSPASTTPKPPADAVQRRDAEALPPSSAPPAAADTGPGKSTASPPNPAKAPSAPNLEKVNPFSVRRASSARLRGLDPDQVLV